MSEQEMSSDIDQVYLFFSGVGLRAEGYRVGRNIYNLGVSQEGME
jgi:hypothetical protein